MLQLSITENCKIVRHRRLWKVLLAKITDDYVICRRFKLLRFSALFFRDAINY